MKHGVRRVLPAVLSTVFVIHPVLAQKPKIAPKHSEPEAVKTAGVASETPTPEALPEAKVIQYSERDIVKVKTRLRYTTLIILPKNEQILDFTCGDKEFWVVNGSQNFAYVKPAKAGAETNLNLVTASGNIYSFVLNEVSETPNAQADLKVFVELQSQPMAEAANAPPRFVSAQVVEDYRQQAEIAKDET